LKVALRKAVATDKERIADISSQIWEGDDYVASVFDDWLADPHGEVVVATLDGVLIAFARRTYLPCRGTRGSRGFAQIPRIATPERPRRSLATSSMQ
jgi:hypothetical protein